MKTYRQHKCGRKHRSYSTALKCAFPHAEVRYDGPWAAIGWDYKPIIIECFKTPQRAIDEAKYMRSKGRRAEAVALEPPETWF